MRGTRAVDITGQKFGRLLVLKRQGKRRKEIAWRCLCECGKFHVSAGNALRSGKTKSCGCYQQECRGKSTTTHGLTETTEYVIWTDLFQRCYNPKRTAFKNYGGRGITVCKRWWDFVNFLEDMGKRPKPTDTLDRINNDKGYSKANCRWATWIEQSRNKRNTRYIKYKGKKLTVREVEELLGFKNHTLYQRLYKYGYSLKEALNTPVGQRL